LPQCQRFLEDDLLDLERVDLAEHVHLLQRELTEFVARLQLNLVEGQNLWQRRCIWELFLSANINTHENEKNVTKI